MQSIFVVIPAYNEEKTIREVIESIEEEKADYRIVIVDDSSVDNTLTSARQGGVSVLRHIVNRGQGAALRTGSEYAIMKGADIIAHFDADGQFLAKEISEIIAPIVSGRADVVFGSRFMGKQSQVPWFKKKVILPLARFVNWWFFDIKLSDPQSGFRALSREAALKISWRQDRMAHCSEIMHQAFLNKLRVKEVPITVIYTDFGQKFAGGIKILKEMFIGMFTK